MEENIKALLESKKTANVYTTLKMGLVDGASAGTGIIGKIKSLVGSKPAINKQNAELGLLLLNEIEAYRTERWRHDEQVEYKSRRYNRIQQLLGEDEWDNTDNYALLIYLFGAEKAPYVRHAWKRMPFQMYQTGYTRRSFRSPNNREKYLPNQINFIVTLIPQSHTYTEIYTPEYKRSYSFYDLSLTGQMKYAQALGDYNTSLFMLWAAAIDMDDTALMTQAEDIVFNRDAEGKLTRSLIKALMNTEKPEAWQLVEKLLLAAQRQEGLRQTILESLDETSIGALKYILHVIIDHQLARFSSVVRAVDVWAGLGWETERETTVRNFLQKAHQYLQNPGDIPAAIDSANNADVYMALWAQGVYDVEQTIPYLEQLYRTGNAEKRTLALLFANATGHYRITMPSYYRALTDDELQPLACAVSFIYSALSWGENDKYYDKHYPALFDTLYDAFKRVKVKEQTFESFVFSWLKIKFERQTILLAMLRLINDKQDRLETVMQYFDEMDAAARRQLSQKILPLHSAYNYKADSDSKNITAFQRNYAMRILKDRSEYEIAFKALHQIHFTKEEAVVFPDLLKRKSAGFRNSVIRLLVNQPDHIIAPVVEETVYRGDVEQRMAALDILLQLQKANRLSNDTTRWLTAFNERKNISQKEAILLSQLNGSNATADISAKNGYGLFNLANLSKIVDPGVKKESLYEKLCALHQFGLSMPFDRIQKAFADLSILLTQYREYEYEVQHWDNSRETVLLGNMFRQKNLRKEFETKLEEYNSYPLPEVWQAWYDEWSLQPQDLLILQLSLSGFANEPTAYNPQLPDYKTFVPKEYHHINHFNNPVVNIIRALGLIHPYTEANEFLLGACARLFANLPASTLKIKTKNNYYYYAKHTGWQEIDQLKIFLQNVHLLSLDDRQVRLCWELYNWRQYAGLPENVEASIPPLLVFCRAFKSGIISEDEMYRGLMVPDSLHLLSSRKHHKTDFPYFDSFPFLKNLFEKTCNYLLDIELKRGDSDTAVTLLASSLESIYGIQRFTQILAGLGKTNLSKGYSYSFSGSGKNKQELFSALLKHNYPLPADTQQLFNESMDKIKASENRLIEAAVYAPQWQQFISTYLGWKGLDTAIWWMHAHTKTDGYNVDTAEAESEIAKYSSVDLSAFKTGAVDKEWFLKAYKEIGKERWPLVYDAAKYVSDGNGHRRARIYADVLLGALNGKAVMEKISTKRDQDYLRIYGLVPLAKKNPGKDVLERYEYLQQFKKESRQFGAQKQTSEALAVRIAMENLARNAGYPDPIRLTWAMETKQVQSILAKETQVQYDDILIGLVIDEEGEADVVAFKDDKQLKAFPPKYKKDVKVEELQAHKKTLRDQFKRSRKGLEDAMVRGDIFLFTEMENLFAHPVISKHLEKLVFIVDNRDGDISRHGFYQDGHLTDASANKIALADTDQLRIAHCTDLYNTGAWPGYQHASFDKKLQQPFKQIFRELYLPTADELQEQTISRRYAGHQVQPKQTAALLRSRGWKADYEEGLQKVFHKEGFVAKLYAMADWFSPAEVEAPTLEIIEFHDLKTFKSIPFTTINERIFSEVMRDIDLVVSIAHVGGVDAEASHSSIEMRSALLRETLRLFKIKNVEIEGSHAKIKGTMGEYSVHLGSAVAHQVAAGYLSILPVHSQHRGRLFLPFADDDPRSAELISKVLLLARDQDIQDPTILNQLR